MYPLGLRCRFGIIISVSSLRKTKEELKVDLSTTTTQQRRLGSDLYFGGEAAQALWTSESTTETLPSGDVTTTSFTFDTLFGQTSTFCCSPVDALSIARGRVVGSTMTVYDSSSTEGTKLTSFSLKVVNFEQSQVETYRYLGGMEPSWSIRINNSEDQCRETEIQAKKEGKNKVTFFVNGVATKNQKAFVKFLATDEDAQYIRNNYEAFGTFFFRDVFGLSPLAAKDVFGLLFYDIIGALFDADDLL